MAKTDFDALYGGKYMAATDVDDDGFVATIERVEVEKMRDGGHNRRVFRGPRPGRRPQQDARQVLSRAFRFQGLRGLGWAQDQGGFGHDPVRRRDGWLRGVQKGARAKEELEGRAQRRHPDVQMNAGNGRAQPGLGQFFLAGDRTMKFVNRGLNVERLWSLYGVIMDLYGCPSDPYDDTDDTNKKSLDEALCELVELLLTVDAQARCEFARELRRYVETQDELVSAALVDGAKP